MNKPETGRHAAKHARKAERAQHRTQHEPEDRNFRRYFSLPRNWHIGDYLCNLSIVTLGIIITFAGNGLIDRQRTARDVRNQMQLVLTELHDNATLLTLYREQIETEQRSARYLLSNMHDLRHASVDSLAHYGSVLYQIELPNFNYDALEMFKLSGLFPSIKDKQLATNILKCYEVLHLVESSLKQYYDIKTSHLMFTDQSWTSQITDWIGFWETSVRYDSLRNIIYLANSFFGYDASFTPELQLIDHITRRIEESYDLQPLGPQPNN